MEFSLAAKAARRLIAASCMLSTFWANPGFTGTELKSGPNRVTMLELFTSQGCSSCPPADQWLSDLIGREGLWTQYVPLAFHVDYWDYIGWKDRFASPANSARQRQYAEDGDVEFVYTPGFVINGKEWRRWRNVSEPQVSTNDAGLLSISIEEGRSFVQFRPPSLRRETLVASIAMLGFGLESDIATGENSGHKLLNDFVVLGLKQASMSEEDGRFSATLQVPTSGVKTMRRAVVVWVTASGSQAPLQVAGDWYSELP